VIVGTYILDSLLDTERCGEALGAGLRPGDIVALNGHLGAGKTTFARSLARGFGITRRVTSPTFITVKSYVGERGTFIHCDLYRVDGPQYLRDQGVLDEVEAGAVMVIEWAEKANLFDRADPLVLSFESTSKDGERLVRCEASGRWSWVTPVFERLQRL
jgi:tRNA threonylcarbamoyladenosine biosynthesis protein TsaE